MPKYISLVLLTTLFFGYHCEAQKVYITSNPNQDALGEWMIYTFDVDQCAIIDSFNISKDVDVHNSLGLYYDHSNKVFYRSIRDMLSRDKLFIRLDSNFQILDTLAIFEDPLPLRPEVVMDNQILIEITCDNKLVFDEFSDLFIDDSYYYSIDLETGVVETKHVGDYISIWCDIINCNGQYYGFELFTGDIYLLNEDDFTDRVKYVGNLGDLCEPHSLECIPRCGMSDILMRSRLCEIQYFDMADFSLISSCYPDIPCLPQSPGAPYGSLGLEYPLERKLYLDLDTLSSYCDDVNASITLPCDATTLKLDFLDMALYDTYHPLDSLNIHIIDKTGLQVNFANLPNLVLQQHGEKDILFNMGVMDNEEFRAAIQQSEIFITDKNLVSNPITIEFQSWECGIKSAIATLEINIEDSLDAGLDQNLSFCPIDLPLNLNDYLDPSLMGGRWSSGSSVYDTSNPPTIYYIQDVGGCPDSAEYKVSIFPVTDTLYMPVHLCEGDSISFNGANIGQAGDYNMLEQNQSGCDSLYTRLSLTQSPPYNTLTLDTFLCHGDTLLYDSMTITEDIQFSTRVQDIYSCDSLEVQFAASFSNPATTNMTEQDLCDGDSTLFFGTWYNETGIFSAYDYDNTTQCLVATNILDLTISDPPQYSTQQETICAGDTVIIDGNQYYETDTYYIIENNSNGCDSAVLELYLIVEPPPLYSQLMASICNGESYTFYGTDYNVSGQYKYTEEDAQGCLSYLEELELIVSDPTQFIAIQQEICHEDSTLFGIHFLNQTGLYHDTIRNENLCDSIIESLDLLVLPTHQISRDSEHLCYGDSILFSGTYYDSPGIYIDSAYNSLGCLSVINSLEVDVSPEMAFIAIDTTLCYGESIVIDDVTYSESERIEYFKKDQYGCDSLKTNVSVDILPEPIVQEAQDTLCAGESIFINGAFIMPPYVDFDTLISQNGCDSLYFQTTYIADQPFVTEVISTDLSGVIGDTIEINTGFVQGNVESFWSPEGIIIADEFDVIKIKVLEDMEITLTLSSEFCDTIILYTLLTQSVEDTIVMPNPLDFNLYIPNAISPNTDDLNKYFFLQSSIESELNYNMSIYDRWGNIVYAATDLLINETQYAWNGKHGNKQPLSQGVYIYKLTFRDERDSIFGTVTVIE